MSLCRTTCDKLSGNPASCPAALHSSLESCCGASRWRPWPFPALKLPRQGFPCHQVTRAAADWDIAYSPGQWYPDEGALGHPLPFLALYCCFSCFIAHTAWGKRGVSSGGSWEVIRGISVSACPFWHSSCLCLQGVVPLVLLL